MRIYCLLVFVSIVGCVHAHNPASASELVNPAAFDELTSEVERLDGQVLQIRENRAISWGDTVRSLRGEIQSAKTMDDLERTFRKLDMAYPSRHASFKFNHSSAIGLVPKVRFASEWTTVNSVRLRISKVDDDLGFTAAVKPQVGDVVVGINGRVMVGSRFICSSSKSMDHGR